jgi:hypothetical protein
MALTDPLKGRIIKEAVEPVLITLAGTVHRGDLIGYSAGWVAADANAAVYAELVAGEDGVSGQTITAYRKVVLGAFTGMTAGGAVYLSDTAGRYSESAGTVSQKVGMSLSATDLLVEPANQFLARAEAVDWDDIEDLADGKVLIGNASNRPAPQTLSGDVVTTNAGVTSINLADGKVFVGNVAGKAAAQTISGDVTVSNAGVAALRNIGLFKNTRRIRIPLYAGFTDAVVDTGVVTHSLAEINLTSGANANSSAAASGLVSGLGGNHIRYTDWTKKQHIRFIFTLGPAVATGVAYLQLKEHNAIGDMAGKGVGVYIANNSLYGESYGTARATVDLTHTVTGDETVVVDIITNGGTQIDWYVNGVLKASQTTAANIPAAGSADTCLWLSITNGATASAYWMRVGGDVAINQEGA